MDVIYKMLRLLSLLLLLVFISGCGEQSDNKTKPERVVPVIAFNAQEVEINDYIEAFGTAKAKESVDITASVTEIIQSIHFDNGGIVNKGDVIAVLSGDEQKATKAALNIQLDEHKRELKRLESLLSSNSVSINDYESRKTQLEITEKKIQEIEAIIQDRVIVAPFSGILGLRNVSEGSLVKPGDIIATLDDVSDLKLDLNVPDKYINIIKKGMLVSIAPVRLNTLEDKAIIAEIDSRVNPRTRSIKIRAIIDNKEQNLKPGLFIKAKIYFDKRVSIFIPEESVTNDGDSNYVWIIGKDNIVFKKLVLVGTRVDNYAEITSGLNISDMVVARGILFLQDGSKVNVSAIQEGPVNVFK